MKLLLEKLSSKPKKPKKRKPMKRLPSNTDYAATRYFSVHEDLPPFYVWYIGYSEVLGSYHICNLTPARGWIDVSGNSLGNVTHWCDKRLYLPFEIRNTIDVELARKYGYYIEETQ